MHEEYTLEWSQSKVFFVYYFVQNVFGLCSLEVRDIQKGDSGVYSAHACNTMGEVTSSAKLSVYGK